MDTNNYQFLATRTEKKMVESSCISAIAIDERDARLLHSAMGAVTEAGELMDALKRLVIYGKPLDITNIKEELGDILWYIAIGCDALDTSFAALMRANIAKLQARFPDKFDAELALNRTLSVERAALENTK